MESRAGERTTVCASQYSAQPDATPKMFCTSNDVVIVVGPSDTPPSHDPLIAGVLKMW